MDRVLLDGTTLMSASQLVSGDEPPSALNVYALSLLVECLILHEEVIVLDTQDVDDARLTAAAAQYGDAVWVEKRTTRDIVDRYVALEFDDLADLPSWTEKKRLEMSEDRRQHINDAADQLRTVLNRQYFHDGELDTYFDLLDTTHKEEYERGKDEWRSDALAEQRQRQLDDREDRLSERSPVRRFVGRRMGDLYDVTLGRVFNDMLFDGPPDRTALGSLTGERVWEDFVDRYSSVSGTSWWADQKLYSRVYENEFRHRLLVRTHFYLAASEVLGAPYRPDVVRAPICWKFFDRGRYAKLGLDERLVDLAEEASRARATNANEFLGRPVFTALPLFLARLLADSRNPADLIPTTLNIRNSAAATRFRNALSDIAAAEREGEISSLLADAQHYSDLLRRQFGGPERGGSDVLWSLAGDGAKAALDPSQASLVTLGGSLGRGAIGAPAIVRRWWFRRKMALIAKTIQAGKRAKSMQPELTRLFGAPLAERDVQFLQRMDNLGREDS